MSFLHTFFEKLPPPLKSGFLDDSVRVTKKFFVNPKFFPKLNFIAKRPKKCVFFVPFGAERVSFFHLGHPLPFGPITPPPIQSLYLIYTHGLNPTDYHS